MNKLFSAAMLRAVLVSCSICIVTALALFSCQQADDSPGYKIVTIHNESGMTASFCENGARLMSLFVPDKSGKLTDVVIGFSDPSDYDSSGEPYFGATIGRFGNRICKGKFELDGKAYQLTANNGENTLHGGKTGFQYQNWKLEQVGDSSVVCSLVSPDGDNGFPGKLEARVTYTLTDKGALEMEYEAVTDKPTVVNLTNHAFFNLNGSGSILRHSLMIDADLYTPVDSTLIPTGTFEQVAGSPFDFRNAKTIGKNIGQISDQLRFGRGYDHNFVLNQGKALPAAVAVGNLSGIVMRIFTTEPGLQFYSGNFMQGKNALRNGADNFRNAFCLETQHFPDSPNQPGFPSTVLRPGEVYRSKSIYAFSVEK